MRVAILCIVLFLSSYTLASAQVIPTDFVTCEGPECQACHLVSLSQKILNFIVAIAVFVAILMFVYAGFMYVTAAGDMGRVKKAHGIFGTVALGFILILIAWLLVNFLMSSLLDHEDSGGLDETWNQIECIDTGRLTTGSLSSLQEVPIPRYDPPTGSYDDKLTYDDDTKPDPTDPDDKPPLYPDPEPPPDEEPPVDPSPNPNPNPIPNTNPTPEICADCAKLSGLQVKPGACKGGTCATDKDLAHKLGILENRLDLLGVDANHWRITEACPATRTHKNPCHAQCTCVDANFYDTEVTAEKIKNFITAADSAGLRAYWEVSRQYQKDRLVRAGVPENRIQVLGGWITAPHFSVYDKNDRILTFKEFSELYD